MADYLHGAGRVTRLPKNSAVFGSGNEIAITAQGFDAARKSIRGFTDDMAQKAAKSAMFAAGAKIKDAMQAKIASLPFNESEGFLYDSIAVKVKTYYRRTGSTYSAVQVAIIGPRTDAVFQAQFGTRAGTVAKPAKYAHLIDKGVRPHAIGRGSTLRKGNQTGRMHPGFPAMPFVRPALLAGSGAASAAFARSLARSLARYRKYNRRAA